MLQGLTPYVMGALALTAACGRVGFDATRIDLVDADVPPDLLGPNATTCDYPPAAGTLVHVATTGDDVAGDGTAATPVRTIGRAVELAVAGDTILVAPGRYTDLVTLLTQHDPPITLRSAVPYQAKLAAPGFVQCFRCAGWTIEGFDITADGFVGGGSQPVVHLLESPGPLVMRDNIIRDSGDDTLVRINRSINVVFARNLVYNAGSIGVHVPNTSNAVIEDNLIFTTASSANASLPLLWVETVNMGSSNDVVRRNLLRGWAGMRPWAMLFVSGIDVVLVENNLLVLEGPGNLVAPLWFDGVSRGVVRHNTVVGHVDATYGAAWLSTNTGPIADLALRNNVWSDPTAMMPPIFGGPGPSAGATNITLAGNGYWNGGQPIPDDPAAGLALASDATAVIGDPALSAVGAPLPTWDPVAKVFADGSTTICEAFVRQATALGIPASTGAGVGVAARTDLDHDLLGRPRPTTPTLGALEPR